MDDPIEALGRLNGRRFLQDQLAAVGIPSDTVINYERKIGLQLVSEPPGRGRSREFCLADIYMLKLATEIFILTGSAAVGIDTVNRLMYEGNEDGDIVNRAKDIDYKRRIAHDIFDAPAPFTHRINFSAASFYYLWSIAPKNGFLLSGPGQKFDPIREGCLVRHRMAFINVTQTLRDLDYQLDRIMGDQFGNRYGYP